MTRTSALCAAVVAAWTGLAATAQAGGFFHHPIAIPHPHLPPIPVLAPHARFHHIPIPVHPIPLSVKIPAPYIKYPRQHFHYHYRGCPVDLRDGHYVGYAHELASHRVGPDDYGIYGDEQRWYSAETYGQPVYGHALYESKMSYQDALAEQRKAKKD